MSLHIEMSEGVYTELSVLLSSMMVTLFFCLSQVWYIG
jgi:hypothetical protein